MVSPVGSLAMNTVLGFAILRVLPCVSTTSVFLVSDRTSPERPFSFGSGLCLMVISRPIDLCAGMFGEVIGIYYAFSVGALRFWALRSLAMAGGSAPTLAG